MEIMITLEDLLDSSFRFYLDENFLREVFLNLKHKYKTWGKLAKKLSIDPRNLFGIRRGYEYWKGKKVIHFIDGRLVKFLSELSSIPIKNFERNVIMIKTGFSGQREKISLPIRVDFQSESPETLERSLAEFVYTKEYEKKLSRSPHLPRFFIKEDNHIILSLGLLLNEIEKRMNELRRRGLNPSMIVKKDKIIFEYRNPGTNRRVKKVLPLLVTIDTIFSKEFGKWFGDRAGGSHKVGVANKNLEFIDEFRKFLTIDLLQSKEVIETILSCKTGFNPPENMLRLVDKIRENKTQKGNYAFVVSVSNKLLRNFVFDIIERFWYEIMINSQKNVRYSFYAGLFEAEGSIGKHYPCWSFGLDLNSNYQHKLLPILRRATKLKNLLSIDGFQPIISRKVSNTKKSHTLKYDIRIFRSKYNKESERILFKRRILPKINHEDKVLKIKNLLEVKKFTKKRVNPKLIPEVNVGMVGH